MRIAVLSDIHGNIWALDAVLAELESVNADIVLNLGDCFFGPLDPGETFRRLSGLDWPTVRGNQDRAMIEGSETPTGTFSLKEIGARGVKWLSQRTRATLHLQNLLACHGNLDRDDVTLIERIEPSHVRRATDLELAAALTAAPEGVELILCGHSHQPGTVRLSDGRMVLNPGSVGLPAYRDDSPHPHRMEAGIPHASWAIVEEMEAGWRVELRATPYDTAPPIAAAREHQREDWAHWIATGRAEGV